ncbi:Diacylglycerol kinase [Jannaschia seosinensis]|uniref:Diacylglycerol kinase n=1 Tax=Jannaschia seosinensis TaxID=313367 RepID=A0A0M7BGK8_9RHOB|nr:diacylglycerol kinase family protein [Jannaschia seosinensis]CUH40912.1 Diacylglycerol kinase [Jannaschia seosinensis]
MRGANTEDDTEASPPPACILLNPGSGKRNGNPRAQIEAAMARYPGRFVLREISKGRDISAEADRAAVEYDTIVAAGGDGTIGAIAEAALRHGCTLGILPRGTFNFFARGLNLPEEIDEGIDLIATGQTREISVGEVNDRLFLNNASLGLYPAILTQREGTYRRWGRSRLAAHWSVIATFTRFHRPLSLVVSVDGRVVRKKTPLAFVARSAYQLDLFGLKGSDDVRAERFALFLAPDSSRWGLFRMAIRLAWGSMKEGRDFEYFTGEVIDIETQSRRRVVARDGEREKMSSPFRFRVLSKALRVIAPPEGT